MNDAVPTAGAPPDLARRCLALAVGGHATPERVGRAVGGLLDRPEPVTAGAVLAALEAAVPRGSNERAAAAALALRRYGAVVHVVGCTGYPARLARAWPELGAPLWLIARAPADGLPGGPAVAVVGTRHPTLDGLDTARALGRLLAGHGIVVVSGLARGIDQAAHAGAIDAGGATVGVLGTGLGVDYPRGDARLRDAVAACGGVVTELPPGAGPRPAHFLWRNRVIAGLADVTVVVEGRERSGALQTARLAASQGRDVWAVPGSINAPTSRGPLGLVRDGASVVTRLDDVVEAVRTVTVAAGDDEPAEVAVDLPAPARAVLDLLGTVPASAGALATAAALPLPAVLAAAAELTARGLARVTPRGLVRAGAADP